METRVVTLPNLLTLLRILLIPIFLWAILHAHFAYALMIFFIAGITDGLDGFIARRFNQKSRLGQWLDPAADKLLLTSTYIVLSLPGYNFQPIPLWLTAIIIMRDLAIVLAAFIIQRVTGFSDFKPSQPGKWNTTILISTVLLFLVTHALGRYTEFMDWFYGLALAMTIFSGLHYIYFIYQALTNYSREH